jgi:organic radical activating enzyme
VETVPGTGRYDFFTNNMAVEEVMKVVGRLRIPGHHSVSVTGGEPLVQGDFLRGLLGALRDEGHRIYLETNSTFPEELPGIIEHVEYVAADIKLPSCTGEEERFEVNLEFLKGCDAPHIFVKLVLAEGFDEREVLAAVKLVKASGRKATVVIQPATGRRGEAAIGGGPLLEVSQKALELYSDVRVIPRINQLLKLA